MYLTLSLSLSPVFFPWILPFFSTLCSLLPFNLLFRLHFSSQHRVIANLIQLKLEILSLRQASHLMHRTIHLNPLPSLRTHSSPNRLHICSIFPFEHGMFNSTERNHILCNCCQFIESWHILIYTQLVFQNQFLTIGMELAVKLYSQLRTDINRYRLCELFTLSPHTLHTASIDSMQFA